jgi:hypothetical protein
VQHSQDEVYSEYLLLWTYHKQFARGNCDLSPLLELADCCIVNSKSLSDQASREPHLLWFLGVVECFRTLALGSLVRDTAQDRPEHKTEYGAKILPNLTGGVDTFASFMNWTSNARPYDNAETVQRAE